MNFNMKSGGRIVIDGREFTGNNISIVKGKVTVDGVVQDGQLVGDVKIDVYGDVVKLDAGSGNVTVSGTCEQVSTMSGDVQCGDVHGNIKTMSGDVTCGTIGGSVSTMSGSIRHRL